MAVYRYPPEVHEFVKLWAPVYRDADLAEECNKLFGTNFNVDRMKAFRNNHNYRNGHKQWSKEEYWRYQKRYPQGMYEFIRDNSWGVPSKDMARMVKEKFGVEFSAVGMKQFRQRHGIKSGLTGWYQRGHSPGNKGRKIEEYMSPEAVAKVRQSTFKKGHRPANEKELGSIMVMKGRKYIKVSQAEYLWDRWKPYNHYIWEQHHGPVPEGRKIMHKDGDPMNCDIDNLELVTFAELVTMNRKGYRSKDPEQTMTGLAVVRLMNKAKEKRTQRKGEEDD